MGKKTTYRTIDIPEKGTLLQQFTTYLETHKKKSDIIDFLSITNARYLSYSRNLSEEKKKEVREFADYFYDNFYDLMFPEMMANWGDDPFILRLAEMLEHEEHVKERKKVIRGASANVRKEAATMADTLFAIREHRCFTLYYNYGEDTITGTFELPMTIYRTELQDAKEELLYLCTIIVENRGTIVTRLLKGKQEEIFGIHVMPHGIWRPVSKEELRQASLVTPNGIKLEPEENVTYTEIQRELF